MFKMYDVLKKLDHERLAGSENERKAAEVIVSIIESFGLKADTESFDLLSFDTGTAFVEIDGTRYPAHPFGLNGSIDMNGELCFVENPASLQSGFGKYTNNIVMIYGYDRGMYHTLKDNGVAACITIGSPNREASSWSHRQKAAEDGIIPSVSMAYDAGVKVSLQHGKKVRLHIEQSTERRTANNIIVTVPGTGVDDAITYLTGHYDTVARSHGSCDNAGGVACMLGILEKLSKKQPARTLQTVFFSGEELGLRGSLDYTARHADEIKKNGALVVNIDVSGDMLGNDMFFVLGTNEHVGYVDGITREKGLVFKTNLDIYSSDCMPFSQYEIPSVNIARFGGEGTFYGHTPGDIAKRASQKGLMNSFIAGMNLIDRLLNAPVYPMKRQIDPSLREKIEKYLWNLTYEEPKLQWKEKYKRP